MTQGFKRVIPVVLLALTLAMLPILPSAAQAQQDRLSITTSPLPINLKANPGEVVSTDLRVRTDGPNSETLQITLLKFTANNEQGQPRLSDREPGDDYFDWVTFSETRFVAEPNVWKTIKMTIDIPETAGLGYYYAVAFTRAGDSPEGTLGAAVDGGAATLVLLDVYSPNAKREIEVAEFTSKRRVYEFLPAEFTVTINNTGNIHLVPSGEIFINKGDESLATLKVNVTNGNVLPGTKRSFTMFWNDGFPHYQPIEEDGKVVNDENGNPKSSLSWDGMELSKLRIGRYTANLLMVYDDGERDVPIEATLSFWVIPWRILGVLLLIIGLIGFALFVIFRKTWRRLKTLRKK